MASTGFSRSKFEMKDSWGAPFVRVVVGRVDVDAIVRCLSGVVGLYYWVWLEEKKMIAMMILWYVD